MSLNAAFYDELCPEDVNKVEQTLSQELIQRGSDYPDLLLTIAEGMEYEPLPHGYSAKTIDVYHQDLAFAVLVLENGKILHEDPEFHIDSEILLLVVDDIPRYARIGNSVELDRTGGLILPDALFNPSSATSSLLQRIDSNLHNELSDTLFDSSSVNSSDEMS